jgi:pantoate--beta-alanine ligase
MDFTQKACCKTVQLPTKPRIMLILHKAAHLIQHLNLLRQNGKTIGFAPTMGALHNGHISLIEESKKHTKVTVCSIFVNPAQFNNPQDFEKYPITIAKDIEMLVTAGCDVLFLPSVDEIYPTGFREKTQYDLGFLETVLEGPTRPGHFQGVCLVMERLISIVIPNSLFMGLKDYQQCMVVKRLLQLKGWQQSIEFFACPTLREPDGLAMSSRNMRLTTEQRALAPVIYECLLFIKENIKKGTLKELKQAAVTKLAENGFKVDYAEIADKDTLEIIDEWDGKQPLTALIAAFLGDVRLIDNMVLST